VARKAMTRIRSSTSELRVESGRFESRVRADLVGGWRRLRREEQRCVLCFTEVEDGVHLMLRCPAYSILREGLLGSLVGLGIRDQEVADYADSCGLAAAQGGVVPRDAAVEARAMTWMVSEKVMEISLEFAKASLAWRNGLLEEPQQEL